MADAAVVPGMLGIHHVALAVADLDAALVHWTQTMGAQLELRATVVDQGVDAASLLWPAAGHGSTALELVAPLSDDSGVARFLERRGAGLHHVAWSVVNVQDALDALARAGARLIDATPRIGLHGTPVAFVHPASMGGALVELVEGSADAHAG